MVSLNNTDVPENDDVIVREALRSALHPVHISPTVARDLNAT